MKTLLSLLLPIFILLTIIGCGSKEPEITEVANKTEVAPIPIDITQTGDYDFDYSSTLDKMYGYIKATYSDYAKILSEQKIHLHTTSSNATYIQETLDNLPKGGIVTIKIYRGTIEGANTRHFMFVVTKDSKELKRVVGEDIFPNTPGSVPYWYNTFYIPLDGFIDFNQKVVIDVIDMMSDTFDTITITRKEAKQEQKEEEK